MVPPLNRPLIPSSLTTLLTQSQADVYDFEEPMVGSLLCICILIFMSSTGVTTTVLTKPA